MTEAEPIRVESLIAHTDWLRRLARSLVADEASADDAVQQTYLAALRRPPLHGANPKGWLATVVRNAVRQVHRADRSRARRETAVALGESGDGVAAVARRVDLQRRLASIVLELPEPGRSVVLLRYYEGLSQAEIARRLDLPASTVRNRHRRTIAELRRRLDEEHSGERRAWLAPLAADLITEGIVMSAKAKLLIGACVVLALVAAGVWLSGGGGTDGSPSAPPPAAIADAGSPDEKPKPVKSVNFVPAAAAWREPGPADVSGDVRDEKGEPIGGAVVRMFASTKELPSDTVLFEMRTDHAGRYVLGPCEETVVLEASADGRATIRRPAGPGDRQDFVLQVAGEVSGLVRLAETRDPCADAIITLSRARSSEILLSEKTAEDGRFTLAGVVAGLYDLVAHPAAAPPVRKGKVWVPATGKTDLLFEVLPGARLTGRVYDEGTGQGIPGITVRLRNAPRLRAVSGPTGAYSIEGFPSGTTFSARGWHIQLMDVDLPEGSPYVSPTSTLKGRISPRPTGGDVAYDIPLKRAGAVRGIVVGPDEQPVGGAVVTYHLFNVHGDHDQALVTSAADGSFFLTGIPEANWPMYAMKEGYATIETSHVVVTAGEVTEGVVVPLAPGCVLSGVVVDEGGSPVRGAQVFFRQKVALRYEDGTLNPNNRVTDSRGEFRFTCAPAGAAWLDIYTQGCLPAASEEFLLETGVPIEGMRIEVSRGVTVTGRVEDADGRPAVGRAVSLHYAGPRPKEVSLHSRPRTSFDTTTDGEGRFEQSGLVEGPWKIRVQGAPLVEWNPGDEPPLIRVPVAAGGRIEGRITLEGGGTPGWAEVRGRVVSSPVRAYPHWAGNPADGFVLEGLPDARYVVEAASGGGLFSEPVTVTVANGRATEEVRLVLREGGIIVGRITGLDEKPCTAGRVWVSLAGGGEERREFSIRNGEIALGPLTRGRYRVEVEAGYGRASAEVDVEPGKQTNLDLALDRGKAIYVTVTGPDGKPVQDVVVAIRDAAGKEVHLDSPKLRKWFERARRYDEDAETWEKFERSKRRTRYSGWVLILPVPPGSYDLELNAPDGRTATAKTVVKEDTLARVDVVLE